MNRTYGLRLLRKFAVLGVMLAGLVFASTAPGGQQAGAAPCCSSCEEREVYCYSLPDPQPCLDENFRRCWRWCSFSC